MTFKGIRKRAGKKVEWSATVLGIRPGTLRKYESSEKTPSTDILLKMKDVYNCTESELLGALEFNINERRRKYEKNTRC